MGSDKAMLLYRGAPLVVHVARQVAGFTGSVSLVGPAERYGGLGYPVVEDREPECGPLGGIVSALAATEAEWNMMAACDMPGITTEFVARLFGMAESMEVDVVLPLGEGGRPDPLCAVYHRRCYGVLDAAFRGGTRKVTAALDGLRVHRFTAESLDALHNVNTPQEWASTHQ